MRNRSARPEAAILKACLEYLQLAGIPAWRSGCGATKIGGRFVRFGVPGQPDITGILTTANLKLGRFLGIEIKAPGGRLSKAQQAFIDTINRAGGIAFVARSVEDLRQALRMEGVDCP